VPVFGARSRTTNTHEFWRSRTWRPLFDLNDSETIDIYEKRKANGDDYQHLLSKLLVSFHETAEALERVSVHVEPQVGKIERHLKSAAALEKAHRDYLLKLDSLAK
jgi:hypothetical protein